MRAEEQQDPKKEWVPPEIEIIDFSQLEDVISCS